MLRMPTIPGGWLVTVGATNENAPRNVAERPPELTTTSPVPTGPAPTVAVSCVELLVATFVAAIPATVTVASFANSLPVTVTCVPPVVLPTIGEIAVTCRPVVGCIVDFVEHAPANRTSTNQTVR